MNKLRRVKLRPLSLYFNRSRSNIRPLFFSFSAFRRSTSDFLTRMFL